MNLKLGFSQWRKVREAILPQNRRRKRGLIERITPTMYGREIGSVNTGVFSALRIFRPTSALIWSAGLSGHEIDRIIRKEFIRIKRLSASMTCRMSCRPSCT